MGITREIKEAEQIDDFNGRVVKSVIVSKNKLNILFENSTELNFCIAFSENKTHFILDDNELYFDQEAWEELCKKSALENGGLPF